MLDFPLFCHPSVPLFEMIHSLFDYSVKSIHVKVVAQWKVVCSYPKTTKLPVLGPRAKPLTLNSSVVLKNEKHGKGCGPNAINDSAKQFMLNTPRCVN